MTHIKLATLMTISFSLIFLCSSLKPTDNKELKSRPWPFIIHFQKDSYLLDNKAKCEIDSAMTSGYLRYAGQISTSIYYGDTSYSFNKLDISLSGLCCIEERAKNKYIGLQRGLEIMEYLEQKYKLSRNNIILTDEKCYAVDRDCIEIGVVVGLLKHY